MKFRTGYSSFLATTLDYRESRRIEPERLNRLVSRLRDGDRSVIGTIIKGHYRMVAGIVGELARNRTKREDALGAALLALAEAVNNAAERLYDNNITPYITTSVRYAIKESLANDHTIRMPGRTIRWRIANGERFEDVVPGDTCEIVDEESTPSFALPFVIPMARPTAPSLEFKEAVAKAPGNAMEVAILKLRMEGNNYEEIGVKVGLSTPRIGQIMPPLVARFEALFR